MGDELLTRRPSRNHKMKPLLTRKWMQVLLLAALFTIAAVITIFFVQRWRKTESAATTTTQQGSLAEIPGLAGGDVVQLPKLPTLKNDFVDLSTLEQKYLLCAFISTECEGCSQDERFWKDLVNEISDKNVKFYVIN